MFVEFKDVSFKYYGSDEYVLNQLSFAIEKVACLPYSDTMVVVKVQLLN